MSNQDAILFGFLEGFTEFLPISSTGHLILLSKFLSISQDDFHKSFEIIIQLAAILAVVVYYYKSFFDIKVLSKLFIAFLPTGVVGFLAYDIIKQLFNVGVVAYMLIIGGVVFILMDIFFKPKSSDAGTLDDITYKQSFLIGCFQILSMIPGTSRSGATIVGGMIGGLSKVMSSQFSFMLAVPTMFVATGYDVYKNYTIFASVDNFTPAIIAFVISFFTALIAIKFLIYLIKNIGLYPFGIYRILLGVLFLAFS